MIHHIDVPVSDLVRSRSFYDQALVPLDLALVVRNDHKDGTTTIGYGVLPDPVFWIRSGRPPIERLHIAFLAKTRESVDAFHSAALQAGGVCNGPPGMRPRYAENYYAAFVLDPDGNYIEAVCRVSSDRAA